MSVPAKGRSQTESGIRGNNESAPPLLWLELEDKNFLNENGLSFCFSFFDEPKENSKIC